MFKESKVPILKGTKVIVDAGYQGLQKIHSNVLKPKKKPLTKEQKHNNRQI